jgi:hypothetical protein
MKATIHRSHFSGALAALVAAFAVAAPAWADIEIDNFTAPLNDRFANDSTFIASGFDLSGVGHANTDSFWATLIAPNVFLTANHNQPVPGTDIYYYPNNDPSETPLVRTVAGSARIAGSDLRIGHFLDPLPSTIAVYSLPTMSLSETNFATSGYQARDALMLGNSPTTSVTAAYAGTRSTDIAVGQNHAEGFDEDNDGGNDDGDFIYTVRNLNQAIDQNAGFVYETHEAKLNAGDSGGPLLTVVGGSLEVSGIAFGIGSVDIETGAGETLRDASFYTFTGNYLSQIEDYVAANGIPEPSTAVLTMLATMAWLAGARRRRC